MNLQKPNKNYTSVYNDKKEKHYGFTIASDEFTITREVSPNTLTNDSILLKRHNFF